MDWMHLPGRTVEERENPRNTSFETFHGGDVSCRGLLGCDAVQCCGRI
jgi:hypothetical protein